MSFIKQYQQRFAHATLAADAIRKGSDYVVNVTLCAEVSGPGALEETQSERHAV
jgi:hypothetical protein